MAYPRSLMGINWSAYMDAEFALNLETPESPTQPMSPAIAATRMKLASSFVPIFKSLNHFTIHLLCCVERSASVLHAVVYDFK